MLGSRISGMLSKSMTTFKVANIKNGFFARRNMMTLNRGVKSPILSPKKFSPQLGSQRYFASLFYEDQYNQYLKDPSKLTKEWKEYFDNKDTATSTHSSPQTGINAGSQELERVLGELLKNTGGGSEQSATEATRIQNLYRSYQSVGHEKAKVEPLQLLKKYGTMLQIGKRKRLNIERLDYRFHGFTDDQLDKEYFIDSSYERGFLSMKKRWTLREFIDSLEQAYCQSIGAEYMHVSNTEELNWIRSKIEEECFIKPDEEERIHAYDRLAWAVLFGDFLQSKYNTQKRFGLEGCDSFIPGLKTCIDFLVENGTEAVTLGMPHRGRLNVLANVLRKPLDIIFQEFQGEAKDKDAEWGKSGDVKYHLGTSYSRTYDKTGKKVDIHLLPNPSHLELVDPVVCGYTRGNQHFSHDQSRTKNAGILVHGDAAFAGQGVVYETMQMADLYNYDTGGTIHFIVNNQIGFTTTPLDARSGLYCTDLAKATGAPILHVNADDILAVMKCGRIAAEYRQKFKKDIVIDVIGYRRFGHNELDQPSFTQPLMYKEINQMENVLDKYETQLIKEGTLTKEKAKETRDKIWKEMDEKYNKARDMEANKADWTTSEWDTIKVPENQNGYKETGVPLDKLRSIGKKISTIPEDFNAHRMIRRIYDNRLKSIESGKGIDWGTAEALAFATLTEEDFHVRISGQDVERGTFSHRHATIHHQTEDEQFVPLSLSNEGRVRKFIASNSHLSECAVLGFEYGYSIVNPNSLTIWEAQFGDFYNGAQSMVDQFISSGEAKWDVASGLVMLLPHGYDGQGPEHSSGRLERFLDMCDDDCDKVPEFREDYFYHENKKSNWQVNNCTTAANYFHLLRRQMHRNYRKPLIVMAPKKLLKYKDAGSNIEEFGEGLKFKRTIDERNTELINNPRKVKKIVLCSGQVYYDIAKERDLRKDPTTVVISVEQLFPMPYDRLKEHLEKYSNAKDIVWCQEEAKNYGAYSYMKPRLHALFKKLGVQDKLSLRYAGRDSNSAPATGFSKVHLIQQEELVKEALK